MKKQTSPSPNSFPTTYLIIFSVIASFLTLAAVAQIFTGAQTMTLTYPGGSNRVVTVAGSNVIVVPNLTVVPAPPTKKLPAVNFLVNQKVGLFVELQSIAYDPDGGPVVRWDWDLGDGSPVISGNQFPFDEFVFHTFPAPGTYNVTLTVVDDDGQTNSRPKQITVP